MVYQWGIFIFNNLVVELAVWVETVKSNNNGKFEDVWCKNALLLVEIQDFMTVFTVFLDTYD
jgi:hypothetical protein